MLIENCDVVVNEYLLKLRYGIWNEKKRNAMRGMDDNIMVSKEML
jgi:hypothetical protein